MKYYATKICDKGNIAVDDTILVKDAEAMAVKDKSSLRETGAIISGV